MASVYGGMTDERKACIWRLWQQGVAMSVIARDIAKPAATVYSYLLYHGGIKPRQRSRRSGCLSLEEREMISRGLASCKSLRRISQELGVIVALPRWSRDTPDSPCFAKCRTSALKVLFSP